MYYCELGSLGAILIFNKTVFYREEDRNGRQDPDVRSAPVRGLVRFLGARQFPDEEEDDGPDYPAGGALTVATIAAAATARRAAIRNAAA